MFKKYDQNISEKLVNFEKYVRRQDLSRFLVRYELFKQILNVKGSIMEFGVIMGLALWLLHKLSAILEPYATKRKIIGFEYFLGISRYSR